MLETSSSSCRGTRGVVEGWKKRRHAPVRASNATLIRMAVVASEELEVLSCQRRVQGGGVW